ncbi:hypothetical protein WK56_31145 [Burkholderia ubonensis]|uniref:hypothetical protein n=1 Tax=Burkholderia ubonensis TaxID=101571 RepID=UPI00075A7451|nr:hypothetical protein [Burkholderia ubonensis]KVT65774.1 hypothetical protein WK56_31145 [Burkholderia ubonensis]
MNARAAPKNAVSATHRQIRDQRRHARRIRKCIADLFGCVCEHVGATPDDRHLRAASREWRAVAKPMPVPPPLTTTT